MKFDGYGKIGSVYGHDLIILEHHEKDKRKRIMCRCGCRKKVTHIQYCNGVAMNSGCEDYINKFVGGVNKQKLAKKEKTAKIMKIFGLDNLTPQAS